MDCIRLYRGKLLSNDFDAFGSIRYGVQGDHFSLRVIIICPRGAMPAFLIIFDYSFMSRFLIPVFFNTHTDVYIRIIYVLDTGPDCVNGPCTQSLRCILPKDWP